MNGHTFGNTMATDIKITNIPVSYAPASYSVKVINNFLPTVQPFHYPADWYDPALNKTLHGPYFTPPIFVSHDATYTMWEEGEEASNDIGLASVFGPPEDDRIIKQLKKKRRKKSGGVRDYRVGKRYVAFAEDAGDGAVSKSKKVMKKSLILNVNHTLISSFFRIAPSPCWFSGFHDFEPVSEDGMWYKSFIIPVYPMNSTWAPGIQYMDEFSSNMTDPHGNITRITTDTLPKHSKVFLGEDKTIIPPVAFIKFRIELEEEAFTTTGVINFVAVVLVLIGAAILTYKTELKFTRPVYAGVAYRHGRKYERVGEIPTGV